MAQELEAPSGDRPDWQLLYLARGPDEIVDHRPVFTGDVFTGVKVLAPRAENPKTKTVMVIQHPCAMRPDGTTLAKSILVAEVRPHPVVAPEHWSGYGKLMPLPVLDPAVTTGRRNQAALFDHTYHVHPEDLNQRVACLSLRGLNLLLQRWVYHSSRVVVPTHDFGIVTSSVFEEAELIEEWCDLAMGAGRTVEDALHDVDTWLHEAPTGTTRQQCLEDPQLRSQVRRELRATAATWSMAEVVPEPSA